MKKLITLPATGGPPLRRLNLLFKQVTASMGCDKHLYQSPDQRQLFCNNNCGKGCRAPMILTAFEHHASHAPEDTEGLIRYLLENNLVAKPALQLHALTPVAN